MASKTLLVLLAACLLSLPVASASGGTAGCSQSWARDNTGNASHTHDCAVAVNEGDYILCLGSHEEWDVDDEHFTHTTSCDRGITWR